jgi:hypothetical protein
VAERVLLVDLENIQRFGLGKVPANTRVKIFVGQFQSKLPTALVQQAQSLGSRLEWVRIDGNGRNALDFHIACHVGEGISRFPKGEFVIFSHDKGFDPLVRHVVARGFKCRRVGQMDGVVPKPPMPAHAQAVADLLRRSDKNKRPRKRSTLMNHLVTHFQKKPTAQEIKKAVENLLQEGLIAGMEAAVTYSF